MNKICFPALVYLSILTFGCSTFHYVERPNEYSNQYFNKKSILKIEDGKNIHGTILKIQSDSIHISINSDTMKFGLNHVKSISQNIRKGAGGAQGFGLGFIGGIGLGLIASNLATSCKNAEPESMCDVSRSYSVMGGTILGGLLGSIVGAIIGSNVGSKDVYIFNYTPIKNYKINEK